MACKEPSPKPPGSAGSISTKLPSNIISPITRPCARCRPKPATTRYYRLEATAPPPVRLNLGTCGLRFVERIHYVDPGGSEQNDKQRGQDEQDHWHGQHRR